MERQCQGHDVHRRVTKMQRHRIKVLPNLDSLNRGVGKKNGQGNKEEEGPSMGIIERKKQKIIENWKKKRNIDENPMGQIEFLGKRKIANVFTDQIFGKIVVNRGQQKKEPSDQKAIAQ